MKNRNIYIVIAALGGLLLGYLIFSGPSSDVSPGKDHDHTGEAEDRMWTCSMHPQIRQPGPGDCPICGMDLIPSGSAADDGGPNTFRMTDNALALADIQTMTITPFDGSDQQLIVLSGTVSENADANAVQASFFEGRIETLNVRYVGQEIRSGQELATIYAPELVAAQQELITAAPLKESQPQLYRAVQNKLRNYKLSQEQIEQIEASGKVKEHFPIYATVSGTVTELNTAEGDYVKVGQSIAKLSNLASVWANFDAYERQLDYFLIGQPIQVTSKAYPEKTFQTAISFIDPVLNAATRTVTIRANLPNKSGLLKPGMFLQGRVAVSGGASSDASLQIPASAVMWTGERSVVYLKTQSDQGIFEMREIDLGKRIGDQYQVVRGLSVGDEIVVNGTFTVDAAAQLSGSRSMMNPAGGGTPTGHEGHGAIGERGTSAAAGASQISPEAFQQLLFEYLHLKDALVSSDPKRAEEAARSMELNLAQTRSGGPFGNSSAYQDINSYLDRLLAAKGDLEKQRAEFLELSNSMIELGRGLEVASDTLYVQFCPMADDYKGAFWLSLESEIRNPYFGDAMLSCGEVRETWSGTSGL